MRKVLVVAIGVAAVFVPHHHDNHPHRTATITSSPPPRRDYINAELPRRRVPRVSPARHRRHPGDPTTSQLARLRWCESGRDHSAGVSSDQAARGYYKFMRGTWRGVGGTGDPAAASFAEQTRRAILLYRLHGWSPWHASSSCSGLY